MAKDIAKFATEKPDSPKTYHAENLPKTPTSQVCLTSPFINILLQAILSLEQVSKIFMSLRHTVGLFLWHVESGPEQHGRAGIYMFVFQVNMVTISSWKGIQIWLLAHILFSRGCVHLLLALRSIPCSIIA